MSYSIDVNVLLFASDTSSPRHARAKAFLGRAARSSEVFCLAWTTCMSYLRIATHPSIFSAPLSPSDARSNLDALFALPHVRLISEEDGFWQVYCEIVGATSVRGNLVPDAHLAALLRQHGVDRLYTNDSDFRKFKFVDVRDPFAA
jgi:toxin-antitoxin system PIN domain toxin